MASAQRTSVRPSLLAMKQAVLHTPLICAPLMPPVSMARFL